MIRTNLSTRPFYNERAVHAVAAVLALIILAVTAWQVMRVVELSRYKTDLNSSIRRDHNEADYLAREAQQIRQGLDQKELTAVASSAKEANDLIAQRTFSWTQLFNMLEATLPEDVMLLGVHPEIKEVTALHMDVQGRGFDEINDFWERLEKTGAFKDVVWSNDTLTEDGMHRIVMEVGYTPPAQSPAAAAPAPVPAPSPAPVPPPVTTGEGSPKPSAGTPPAGTPRGATPPPAKKPGGGR